MKAEVISVLAIEGFSQLQYYKIFLPLDLKKKTEKDDTSSLSKIGTSNLKPIFKMFH